MRDKGRTVCTSNLMKYINKASIHCYCVVTGITSYNSHIIKLMLAICFCVCVVIILKEGKVIFFKFPNHILFVLLCDCVHLADVFGV